jgi:spermidine synthase
MITIEKINHLNNPAEIEHIKQLYLSNGWIEAGDGETEALISKIISHTYCFAIAKDGDRIIGMGRSISDGVSDAYIQDVTVLPEYRKSGTGGLIIGFLVDYMHTQGISWVGLISEPGYESFYQKQGFKVMQSYTPFLYSEKH